MGATYHRGKDTYRVHVDGREGRFYCKFTKNGVSLSHGWFNTEQGAKAFMDRIKAHYVDEEVEKC